MAHGQRTATWVCPHFVLPPPSAPGQSLKGPKGTASSSLLCLSTQSSLGEEGKACHVRSGGVVAATQGVKAGWGGLQFSCN